VTLTRREFLAGAIAAPVAAGLRTRVETPHVVGGVVGLVGSRPVPSAAQLAWQHDELALFLHFGVNTFTDREWGDGTESPAIFNPSALDARQWARAAKAAGFRALILTAKHHDGFCLWPTKTTAHSVAASPFRNGTGDVVREFVDACRAQGLKPGLYLSPWDRHEPRYGDSPAYNDFYCDQLTELLTHYGRIDEVWFDGANGEGPNGKKQTYDWPRVWGLVRKLQPQAVMFSDAGPDVRWIGNERGTAGDPNWSTVDPSVVTFPGATGPKVIPMLQHGDPDGTAWRPGETDVSIRPGWFYHPAEDARVKSVDDLVSLYFSSVGRNSKLLLNVPPTRDGQLHDVDVSRLTGMRAALDRMRASEVTTGARVSRAPQGPPALPPGVMIELRRDATVTVAELREDIAHGQSVARYRLEHRPSADGPWQPFVIANTIGHCKLDRFDPVTVRAVRLTILDALIWPRPVTVRLYERA
jgi:alpha-L-fucosidase